MKIIKQLLKWIKGGNDCAHCPAGWEEWGLEDCDAGCYIYGDGFCECCRLPYPLRWFLARRPKYLESHKWDDFGEWYEKQEAGMEKIRDAIKQELKDCCICWIDGDGKYNEVDRDGYIYNMASKSQSAYEDFMREPRKSLRRKWIDLIKETVSIPVNFIKSFIVQ